MDVSGNTPLLAALAFYGSKFVVGAAIGGITGYSTASIEGRSVGRGVFFGALGGGLAALIPGSESYPATLAAGAVMGAAGSIGSTVGNNVMDKKSAFSNVNPYRVGYSAFAGAAGSAMGAIAALEGAGPIAVAGTSALFSAMAEGGGSIVRAISVQAAESSGNKFEIISVVENVNPVLVEFSLQQGR